MVGIDKLRRACEELSSDGDARSRLKTAAREFEAAAAYGYRTWPLGLRREADAIRGMLFRHGVPDCTVDRMTDDAVADTIASLQRFCDEFERSTACG
ncbi:MAG TPA: hypothetical protein VF170_07940 [Planctomycetaceae bacterium]